MTERVKAESKLLKVSGYITENDEEGEWILIKDYPIPEESSWNRVKTDICFQILAEYPGAPPYGFYVPSGILYNGQRPNNYTEPSNNKPPFSGDWGFFSWKMNSGWFATDDLVSGSNLLNFVRTFSERFNEGV